MSYMKKIISIIIFALFIADLSLFANPNIRVKYNFEQDLKEIMSDDMHRRGLNLESCSTMHQLVLKYFNTLRRIIPKQRYEIEISPNLKVKIQSLPKNLQDGIRSVISEASSGVDLLPRHSRRIKNNDYSDPLLNDWGIFHLHLGASIESDGFINRTGELLYVYRHEEKLYLLDVLKHKWADRNLVEVIHNNWPTAISKNRVADFNSVENVATTDDIVSSLRNFGLTYIYKTKDGTAYTPLGGGYVTSGGSIESVIGSNTTIHWLKHMETSVDRDKEIFTDKIYKVTGKKLDSLNLKLIRHDGEFYILETQVGVMYRVKFGYGN